MKESNEVTTGKNGADALNPHPESGEMQFISFRLLEEEFGAPIDNVREILKVSAITPIPRAPAYLMGMMNLRGYILPVMNLKTRMGLDDTQPLTEKNRILVLHLAGETAGVLVDEVSHVQRIRVSDIEPPPQAIRGIDKFFLNGVVKSAIHGKDIDQEHLIMMLNLPEVLKINIARNMKIASETAVETFTKDKDTPQSQKLDEELAVTFKLGEEEFGMEISAVREILKVGEITAVPNVPRYVRGIRNIRDMVLPIIDLRKVIHMPSLEEEAQEMAVRLKATLLEWLDGLKKALDQGVMFHGSPDPKFCSLGQLLERQEKKFADIRQLRQGLDADHVRLHEMATDMIEWLATDRETARGIFNEDIAPQSQKLLIRFQELEKELVKKTERERRILVVELGRTQAGLMVDRVTQVFRLPKNLIDTTPGIISAHDREIRGIARLEEGKRLIMMLDEKGLITQEEARQIEDVQDHRRRRESEAQKTDERQYVIFSLLGEEFGLGIGYVQEIFKAREITMAPKAPPFIRGVANLRGSIIPVVDTAERFGVEKRQETQSCGSPTEEAAYYKILVTTVRDTVVGLLVDNVTEVARIPRSLIEDAPALILSNTDVSYLEGVAKLDNGARIILLLNVDDIMNKKDFQKLKGLKDKLLADVVKNTEAEKFTASDKGEKIPSPPSSALLTRESGTSRDDQEPLAAPPAEDPGILEKARRPGKGKKRDQHD